MMLVVMVLLLPVPSLPGRVRKEVATSEEHIEDLRRVDILLELALPESVASGLGVAWLFACQVIHFSLLLVHQTGICSADFLKGVCGLWRMVFIGMELNCQLLVRLFDVVFGGRSWEAQDLVVVLLAEDFSA